MKKFLALVLSVILVLSLVGCGQPTAKDLEGTYRDLSFTNVGVAADDNKSSLNITNTNNELAYDDGDYSGDCVLEESVLTMTPQEGLTERNQKLLELDEEMGKSNDKSFLVDGSFLIDESSKVAVEIEGTFKENQKTDRSIRVDFSSQSSSAFEFYDTFVEIFKDGTCEFEGGYELTGYTSEYFYEGTYEIIGNTIILNLNSEEKWGTSYENKDKVYQEEGNWTCAIYIKDNVGYTGVYQKADE